MLVYLIIVIRHGAEEAITLEDLGNLGEFTAAIGVVISFIYLAYQIRQNTRSVRLSALAAAVESGNRVRELVILNPELSDLFIKGLQGTEELARPERLQFRLLLQNFFANIQASYVRDVENGLDSDAIGPAESMLDSLLTSPGAREWWKLRRSDYRENFAKFVDDRISRHEKGHAA